MNKIRVHREKAGVTQKQFAETAGFENLSRFSHYERGLRSPDITTAHTIVRTFNKLGIKVSFTDVFPDSQPTARAQ